jgi:hypothetical protein
MIAALQVARDRERPSPLGLDQPLGVRGVVVLAQVRDRHVRSLVGKGDTHRATDA